MSESSASGAATAGREPPKRNWLSSMGARLWVAVAIALVLGGCAGALIHALSTRGDATVAAASQSPSPAPTAPAPTATGVGGPCLLAADLAARALTQLRAVASAVGGLDAARLQAALDEVQRLDPQITVAAQACRIALARGSPSPSPSSR